MNLLELDQVYQSYGRQEVLHDLSLSLEEGEVLGLFGHNGAGKTTSMKLILGLLRPGRGRVQVLGGDPNDHHVRRRLGYLPENVTFYPQLSGRETLRHFARLKGARPAQVDELLGQVGLQHAADRRVKTYSKGMRQRLGLAQALLGEPRLLLLDEPTVGLDPIATHELYELLDRLRAQGTGVILCSHVLPGVERHIDRAAILAGGRLRACGDMDALRAQAQLPVRIRLSGLAELQPYLADWQLRGLLPKPGTAQDCELQVADGAKLDLLRELTALPLRDLELRQPTLEDLYRFFMQRFAARGGEA